MASGNPFGLDDASEEQEEFEEVKLKEKRENRETMVTVNSVTVSRNSDTENSQDTEDQEDWDLIDEVALESGQFGFRPPDYLKVIELINNVLNDLQPNEFLCHLQKKIWEQT